MLFAAAPIANKYKTIMLGSEGGATTMEPMLANMPYIYSVLNYSNHFQLPVFVDLIAAKGAQTVYICFMNDLHGAEYNLTMQSECGLAGITVLEAKSIPINIADMEPIVKEAKDLNPDVFCMFAYPNQNILFTTQVSGKRSGIPVSIRAVKQIMRTMCCTRSEREKRR
jgi:ABC-type branched-subunit amino acid transport system substrate-binding protein